MSILVSKVKVAMDTSGVSMSTRADVLCMATARALGYALPIPSSAVDNAYTFFKETVEPTILEKVDELNENFYLRAAECLELTKRIWVLRYQIVHEPNNPVAHAVIDSITESGMSTCLPGSYMAFYDDHKYVLNELTAIIAGHCCAAPAVA